MGLTLVLYDKGNKGFDARQVFSVDWHDTQLDKHATQAVEDKLREILQARLPLLSCYHCGAKFETLAQAVAAKQECRSYARPGIVQSLTAWITLVCRRKSCLEGMKVAWSVDAEGNTTKKSPMVRSFFPVLALPTQQ